MSVFVRVMHDKYTNRLGFTEADIEELIEDYLSGDRKGAMLDAMIEAHDLSSKRVLEVGKELFSVQATACTLSHVRVFSVGRISSWGRAPAPPGLRRL